MSDRVMTGQPRDRKAANAWPMILLFGALLLVPAVAQLAGMGQSTSENRILAPFPKLTTFKDLADLTRASENYVNDRFGLRSQLVHANSLLHYRFGISTSKDVVIGKDGWLFYTADRILEQHTGADIFKPDDLDKWVRQMEADRDWLAQRNIAFYMVAAPDKNTIYPEKLPDYPRPRNATTRLDQLTARLERSTLDFINPKAALLAAKQKNIQVYFEGDSHWTQRGAFIAYELLMERIRKKFPDIIPKTINDYSVSVEEHPAADLAYLLTLYGDLHYSVDRLEPRGPKHQLAPAATTSRPGWPWRLSEVRTDLRERPRLLIMGDSFTDYVLGPNFLYETFRDPVWTHHNLGTFNFELVKELHPDIVIFQFAERYLHSPFGVPVGMDTANDAR
jgi:alginate O-acetyltransferase complex protein AlgJ